MPESTDSQGSIPECRDFLKVAAAMTAAVGGGLAGHVIAQEPRPSAGQSAAPNGRDPGQRDTGSLALPNDVPPALPSQAAPGGTGAWVDENPGRDTQLPEARTARGFCVMEPALSNGESSNGGHCAQVVYDW